MSKSRKAPQSASSWLGQVEEQPVRKAPGNQDLERRQRWYRIVIWSCVILMPLSLLTVVVALNKDVTADTSTASSQTVNAEAKAAAVLAVRTWMNQSPSPLLGGDYIGWVGFTHVEKPEQTAEQETTSPLPDYEVEVHSFTVRDKQGVVYTVEVQVAIDPAKGTQVIGEPSLMPVGASDTSNWVVGTPWFGMPSANIPEAISEAAKAWGSAYASGDSNKLRLAVGDPKAEHSYVPLQNVARVEATVSSAAWLNPSDDGNGSATDQMIARVQLSILWAGQSAPENGSPLPTLTFDVLVDKASTASPVIVAWGGPGDGPTLERYGQALVGRTGGDSAQPDGDSVPNDNITEED